MARKKAVSKSPARKAVAKKTAVRKKPVRKAAGKRPAKTAAGTRKKATRKVSLGRPRIPADARLDLVFQKDYQAREVFDFLRVETIRELEQYAPQEIIDKLTGPMVQTVQRIRKALALANRCLAGDQEFAAEFKAAFARRG